MYCILRLSSSVSELIKSSSKIFVTRQMTFLLFSFILYSFQFHVHGSPIIPVIPWYKIESDMDGVWTQTEKPSWASPTMRSTFSVTVAIWRSARNNSSWSSWETLYHLKKCYYWIRFELSEHEHGLGLRLKWPTMVHGLLVFFKWTAWNGRPLIEAFDSKERLGWKCTVSAGLPIIESGGSEIDNFKWFPGVCLSKSLIKSPYLGNLWIGWIILSLKFNLLVCLFSQSLNLEFRSFRSSYVCNMAPYWNA